MSAAWLMCDLLGEAPMVGLAASFAASRCVVCRTGRSIYARSRGVASLVLPCGCVWTCRMMWHASCRFNHILLLPARPPHARCAALTYSPRVHAMPQTGDERCLKQRRGKLWERVLWMRACAVHRGGSPPEGALDEPPSATPGSFPVLLFRPASLLSRGHADVLRFSVRCRRDA